MDLSPLTAFELAELINLAREAWPDDSQPEHASIKRKLALSYRSLTAAQQANEVHRQASLTPVVALTARTKTPLSG